LQPKDQDEATGLTENRVWEKESLKKLLDKVNDYRDLGVKNVLQIELLARLAAGRSTASDLAVEAFSGNNPGAVSRGEYMRTMRSLAALERKGYVTRALFGKDKPYRLTHHGEDAVEAIIGGRTPQALIPRRELLSFALAGLAAATSAALTYAEAGTLILIACWLATGILTGLCLTRFVQTARRIW